MAGRKKGRADVSSFEQPRPGFRRRLTQGRPGALGEIELGLRDRPRGRRKVGNRFRLQAPDIVIHLDQQQRAGSSRMIGEPVEHLKQLELIVEIVLEPQHHAVELGAHGKPPIARRELELDGPDLAAAGAGQILDAAGGQVFERLGERDGAFMQHVAPRQDLGARQRAAKQFAGRVAVGDDEIGHFTRGRDRAPHLDRESTPPRAASHTARTRRWECRRADTNSRRCEARPARPDRRSACRW